MGVDSIRPPKWILFRDLDGGKSRRRRDGGHPCPSKLLERLASCMDGSAR
jgi:hypothetical protein